MSIDRIHYHNRLHGFQARFPSTLEVIDEVEQQACDLLGRERVDLDMFGFRLVIREALFNAIFHGNQAHMEKAIEFAVQVDRHVVRIQVTDEGAGFDWGPLLSQSLDPTAHTGRGLTILKAYANKIIYNQRGNELTLEINLGGLPG